MKQKSKLDGLKNPIFAALLAAAAYFLPLTGLLRAFSFLPALLLAGGGIHREAAEHLIHGEVLDEEFLMALASLGAFVLGDYPEAVAVLLFFAVGEWFEELAEDKSRSTISALTDIRPDKATVLRNGVELEVSPDEVEVGESVVLKPGDRVPLDGVILSGSTAVDTAALTGESMPTDRFEGDRLMSGFVNLTGVVILRAEKKADESTAARILALVENAAEKKTKTERFITRFAGYYTPCVVGLALLLALVPPLLGGGSFGVWVRRALMLLVVSCPCALVISVPLSFFRGIGVCAANGVLLKSSGALEMLAKLNTLLFDKTGTLTKGVFGVEAVHPEGVGEAELLDIAAAAERYSAHPAAECITAAHGGDIDPARLGEVHELAGLGVEAELDGKRYFVGSDKLMRRAGADYHACRLHGTVIHVACGSEYLGHIVIQDKVKPEAPESIRALRRLGMERLLLITGDGRKPAEAVAKELQLDGVRCELLPADKVEAVEAELAEGRRVGFVGDGMNDAPVLRRSDLGIAMGALGSDAAIEAADVVLMDDKLQKLPFAIRSARKTVAVVKQNVGFSLGCKALILLFSALGLSGMWLAVFGDVGVMVLTVLNAMRAGSVKTPESEKFGVRNLANDFLP